MDERVIDLPDDQAPETEEEGLEALLAKARDDFERDREADSFNRTEAYNDISFVAEPYTQWFEEDRRVREEQRRPCPALNRLAPFLKQVTNDIRMNKPEINLSPVESEDRNESDLYEAIINHIERNSMASRGYARWAEDGVWCGIGHLEGTFQPARGYPDQMDIVLEHIRDPLSVIWDRSATRPDRGDARHCFVVDYLPKDEVDEEYRDALGDWPDEEESTAWSDWHEQSTDEVRVVRLYRVATERFSQFSVMGDLGIEQVELGERDEVPEGAIPLSETRRKVVRMWLMTAGKVLAGGIDGEVVPGERIPVFPYIPSETRIGRRVVRKGLVRDAKDSVRMINWAMALIMESMAAAPKPKWVGRAKAFEGYEEEWDAAPTSNRAYLRINDAASDVPQYQQPPAFHSSLINAVGMFDENIKQVTGIYDASLGARSNETSGKAINARERQGDTATYDYIDEFVYALESVGRWLVEVIPEVYNQPRMLRIVGQQQDDRVVQINSYDAATGHTVNPIERRMFDVDVKVGPGFATQREEAAQTMEAAIRAAPQLAPILLDLMIGMQDWPGADKAAKRLSMMLPPQIQAMESGQPMPPPPPDPEAVASAQKDMASADKTRAETDAIRVETRLQQLEAVLMGLPPQLVSVLPPSGMTGAGAPNGQPMPGSPQFP